ncbi:ankyrin, partial [Byssothecium circinans]
GERGTVLQLAVESNQIELVQSLLQAGADPNAESGPMGTALGVAINQHSVTMDTTIVNTLIAAGADVNMMGKRGLPLHQAAADGNLMLASKLLSNGADPNKVDHLFGTALHAAIAGCHLEVIEFLLSSKVNINA